MGAALQFSVNYARIECVACGMVFSVPESWEQTKRRDHSGFFCPNGHTLSFHCKSDVEKLRDELDAQKRATEFQRQQRLHAEQQLSAAKGQITKIKNRVGNGVCPCCNRTFQNLMRHMSTKHPDYSKEGA